MLFRSAGLDLTDPKAREEYFDNFIGGAVLAGVMGPFGRAAERGQIVREGKKLETARLGEEQRVAQETAQKAGLETAQMPPTPQGGVETLAGGLDRAYAAQSQLKSISDQMATLEAKFSDPAQYTMAEYPVLREQYKQLEQQYNEIAEKQPYLPSTYEALQRKIAYKTKQFETAVKAQKFEDADKLQQEVAELRQQVEDRKSTRLNSSHSQQSRMPSSA